MEEESGQTNGFLSSLKRVEPRVPFASLSPATLPTSAAAGVSRPRPQIAHITPTPQIEHGQLCSPAPGQHHVSGIVYNTPDHGQGNTTPRIPLGELDSTQLSQRLFHNSPGVNLTQTSPSGLSFCHQQLSPSHLLHTSQQPSPSHLLHTQVPQSSMVRDRRHQKLMERRVTELSQQVQDLGNMMASQRLGGGNNVSVYQLRAEQLENEKDELEALLEEKDGQMEALRNSISTLNAEYMADLNCVKEKCLELGQVAQEKEQELAKLQIERQKSLKTIKGLKSYIEALPAEEEVRDLKAKLEARTSQLADNESRMVELEQEFKLLREELNNCRREKLKLELANKEAKELNKELTLKAQEDEKRRQKARNLEETESQMELLVFDKEEMKIENDKLRNLLNWKTKKFEDEKSKMEDQVRNLGKLLEEANKKVQETSTSLRNCNAAKAVLETDLKSRNESITKMTSKLERLGAESHQLRTSNDSTSQLDGHFSRLTRSMGKCVTELNSLTDLCTQILGGSDPNMSLLLGTRDVHMLRPVSSLNRDLASLSHQEKLQVVKEQLKEIRQVEVDIKELRSKISDIYSDKLSEKSCIIS